MFIDDIILKNSDNIFNFIKISSDCKKSLLIFLGFVYKLLS